MLIFLNKSFLSNPNGLIVSIAYSDTYADKRTTVNVRLDPKKMIKEDEIIKMAVKK